MAGDCAKCGACLPVCPVYQVTGRESDAARGKLHLLEKIPPQALTAEYARILGTCLLCGACYRACPRQVDTPGLVAAARAALPGELRRAPWLYRLTRRALADGELAEQLGRAGRRIHQLLQHLPASSGLRYRLAFLADAGTLTAGQEMILASGGPPATTRLAYFAGCYARHVQPAIALATDRLARAADQGELFAPAGQTCCGLAAHSAGDSTEARELARRNIAAFENSALPILTSCASCYAHLQSYPGLLASDPAWHERARSFAARVREFSTFFNDTLPAAILAPAKQAGRDTRRLLYHDPCHLRFAAGITEEPRQLIKRLPDVELAELPNGPRCCGQGGLFPLLHPELSGQILARALADFAASTALTVVTTCTGCLIQWQNGLARQATDRRAVHLAMVLAAALPTGPDFSGQDG